MFSLTLSMFSPIVLTAFATATTFFSKLSPKALVHRSKVSWKRLMTLSKAGANLSTVSWNLLMAATKLALIVMVTSIWIKSKKSFLSSSIFFLASPAAWLFIVVRISPTRLVLIETSTPESRFFIDASLMLPFPSNPIRKNTTPRNTPANVPISPKYVGNAIWTVDWSYLIFNFRSTLLRINS